MLECHFDSYYSYQFNWLFAVNEFFSLCTFYRLALSIALFLSLSLCSIVSLSTFSFDTLILLHSLFPILAYSLSRSHSIPVFFPFSHSPTEVIEEFDCVRTISWMQINRCLVLRTTMDVFD